MGVGGDVFGLLVGRLSKRPAYRRTRCARSSRSPSGYSPCEDPTMSRRASEYRELPSADESAPPPSTPCCSPRYRLDWYLSAPCGSPSCASRGCRVLGDVSRSVGPVSVPTRLATGVLMRVHLCVFVPCTSSRLVSSVIVFSGNWRCAPALPQLAVSEPAGVPSWGGTVRCGACAESL